MDHRHDDVGVGLSSEARRALELMATGLSSDEVATRLGTSPEIVRQHLAHALAELGAYSKLEAIVKAAALGLIELPGPDEDR